MKQLCLLALSVAACIDSSPSTDLDLAASEPEVSSAEKLDAPGWENARTLHEGASLFDHASANTRRVHSLWMSGSNMNPVPLIVEARASDTYDVRIAVLGPIVNGQRAVLGADGYSQKKRNASVTLNITQPGEHLVVVGSYNLATETFYDLHATCPGPGCGVSRYDVLATPKDGALVGDSTRLVQMMLGDVMVGRNF